MQKRYTLHLLTLTALILTSPSFSSCSSQCNTTPQPGCWCQCTGCSLGCQPDLINTCLESNCCVTDPVISPTNSPSASPEVSLTQTPSMSPSMTPSKEVSNSPTLSPTILICDPLITPYYEITNSSCSGALILNKTALPNQCTDTQLQDWCFQLNSCVNQHPLCGEAPSYISYKLFSVEGDGFDVYTLNETICGAEMILSTSNSYSYSWEFSCLESGADGSVVGYQVGCTVVITWLYPKSQTLIFVPRIAQGWCASLGMVHHLSIITTSIVILTLLCVA